MDTTTITTTRVAQQARQTLGMYGPTGWTVQAGIWTILADCRDTLRSETIPGRYGLPPARQIIDGHPTEDYTPFHDLGPDHAATLLRLLPGSALSERQNLGPSLGACLRACAAATGSVRLSGYAIGPQRRDERLTVDGMWIDDPDLLALSLCSTHGANCDCTLVWDTIATRYDLDAHCHPDEIRHALRQWTHGPAGTWIWWD